MNDTRFPCYLRCGITTLLIIPADVLNFVMSEIDRRKELCDLLAKFEGAGEYVDHPIMLVGESYLNG